MTHSTSARPLPRRPRRDAPPTIYPSAIVDAGARVGRDAVIGAFCFVAGGAVIGPGARLQSHVSVWNGVELGADVFVGPAVTFTNVRHPRADFVRAPAFDATHVGDGATLGANCVLVAPVRIGARAVVAAGAVVTRDVPDHAIVAGNPARVIGWACDCGETVSRDARRPKRLVCASCAQETKTKGSRPPDAPSRTRSRRA